MARLPSGWYPYRSDGESFRGEPESWRSLAIAGTASDSKRRYWDGTKWEGATVSNDDVLLTGTCERCKKATAFIRLTEGETHAYVRAESWESFIKGASIIFNPTGMLNHFKDIWVVKFALTLKCLQCFQHIALCPYCTNDNFATPGISTCKKCAGKYQVSPNAFDLPAGVKLLGRFYTED
jgi:hypothetical protein